ASQLDTPLSNSPLFAGLLAGYAALAVSKALGFSTVSVGVLFFLFPAFALSLIAPKNSSQIRVHPGKLKWSQISSLVVVGIVLVGYLYQIGRYYVADLVYASGNGAESKND